MSQTILHCTINTPLRREFDYLMPAEWDTNLLQPGQRVLLPFGSRTLVGILLRISAESTLPKARLKPALALLSTEPLFSTLELKLLQWASHYYQHPIGEVVVGTLPARLRSNKTHQEPQPTYCYIPTEAGLPVRSTTRSTRQQELLAFVKNYPGAPNKSMLVAAGFTRATLNQLLTKEWLRAVPAQRFQTTQVVTTTPIPILHSEQQVVIEEITKHTGFQAYLLDGITGSGKTEVYLQLIANVVAAGKQALVLVPEINLTPQMVQRFTERFAVPTVVLHSKLGDNEREQVFWQAKHGEIAIVIGTRSAVFSAFDQLGIIIVDEEQDSSFKQHSSFRYHARDVALMRAKLSGIPIVLGSATPSLETLHNAQRKRYHHLHLTQRAGGAKIPSLKLIDIRHQFLEAGLSPALLRRIAEHLSQQGQVILLINRRGYAPLILCHACGWMASCSSCDAKLTLHQQPRRLVCHHCGQTTQLPSCCPSCKASDLIPIGQGTERLQEVLQQHFSHCPILRIDSDTTRRKGSLETLLTDVHAGKPAILVGTQILAKGHHFPNVSLVASIDTDGGLFSVDFRAAERMVQLLVQVAGRAGRAQKTGEVFIQTHVPEHPLLQSLVQETYYQQCRLLLQERQTTRLPPYTFLTIIRADAPLQTTVMSFLQQARNQVTALPSEIQLLGPIPAVRERRQNRYHAQLIIQATSRQVLQAWLPSLIALVDSLKTAGQLHWVVDVDPQEI